VPALAGGNPRAMLFVGEGPMDQVHVEQVALNVFDTGQSGNGRGRHENERLVADGPLALCSRWDAPGVVRKLQAAGIPACASFHAGTYACNASLYLALRATTDSTAVGFLHIPYRRWPHGLRLGLLIRAVGIAIESLMPQGALLSRG